MQEYLIFEIIKFHKFSLAKATGEFSWQNFQGLSKFMEILTTFWTISMEIPAGLFAKSFRKSRNIIEFA